MKAGRARSALSPASCNYYSYTIIFWFVPHLPHRAGPVAELLVIATPGKVAVGPGGEDVMLGEETLQDLPVMGYILLFFYHK